MSLSATPQPIRKAYSRDEIMEEARAYMVETFGKPSETVDTLAWHTKYGMLVDFLHDRFPT